MANTAQSKKRARQAEKHRQRNTSQKSAMRTQIKSVRKMIEAGEKKEATVERFQEMSSHVDKLASKNLIHKNKAARYKKRLNASIKAANLS